MIEKIPGKVLFLRYLEHCKVKHLSSIKFSIEKLLLFKDIFGKQIPIPESESGDNLLYQTDKKKWNEIQRLKENNEIVADLDFKLRMLRSYESKLETEIARKAEEKIEKESKPKLKKKFQREKKNYFRK